MLAHGGKQTIPANWRPADDLYRQMSQLANDGLAPSDHLAGLLARALGRILASYDGYEEVFMLELLDRWSNIDERKESPKVRFHDLYTDKRFQHFAAYSQAERTRPRPFEAAIETCRRLIATNHIAAALSPIGSAGILGGSVAYGRFFNTKGVNDPSDLDLMVVLPTYESHLGLCAQALSSVEGTSAQDLEKLRIRVDTATELARDDPTISVSHKVKFWEDEMDPFLQQFDWNGTFTVQLHFFSLEAFNYVVLKDQGFVSPGRDATFYREANDYREDKGRRGERGATFSFAGTTLPFNRSFETVTAGYVTNEVVCRVEHGRFHTGIFHNLILPQLEVRWDSLDFSVALATRAFAWKLFDRLMYERHLRPWEDQNLANSHIRRSVFSPHELRRVLTLDVWA